MNDELEEGIETEYTRVPYTQKLKELKLYSLNERIERYMLVAIGNAVSGNLNLDFIKISENLNPRHGIKIAKIGNLSEMTKTAKQFHKKFFATAAIQGFNKPDIITRQ